MNLYVKCEHCEEFNPVKEDGIGVAQRVSWSDVVWIGIDFRCEHCEEWINEEIAL